MNSTPNYHFEKTAHLCAIGDLDRELRRVEDKVDGNTASILDRYTKTEVDYLLRKCKGGSCGPSPCGCDCGPELEKLWKALRARYSNEEIDRLILKYIREHDGDPDAHPEIWRELEKIYRELGNKVNTEPLTPYPVELSDGWEQADYKCLYYKDSNERITVSISAWKRRGTFSSGELIATLPIGYRPYTSCAFTGNWRINDVYKVVHFVVHTNGSIYISGADIPKDEPNQKYFLDATFLGYKPD